MGTPRHRAGPGRRVEPAGHGSRRGRAVTSHRHQRRAALPGAGYTRPSSLDPTGLIVTVFGESGGVEGTFDFTVVPGGIELRRAFAAALDRKSGPAGAWRSGETCRNGYWALRGFLEDL